MIQCVNPAQCYGCTACASVCPKGAIAMKENEEGFKYPSVDENACVSCGLCKKVCPVLNRRVSEKGSVRTAYGVQHTDPEVLKNSTSGGMFTALSDRIFAEGGVVCGAAFDEQMTVRHIRATTVEERNAMRGSKYVQSDLGEIFAEIKRDLSDGRKVLFTGTPCQVDGLRRFLGDHTEGLVCVDLICHGSPSPKILREQFRFIEKKTRRKLVNYQFRPKRWSWHVHREIAHLEGGKELHSNAYSDLWQQIYYMRLCHRPSCHSCQYSNIDRVGDLTIADCRGIDKIVPDFGSDAGVSLVLVNTPLGEEVMEKLLSTMKTQELSLESVMQPPLRQPSKPNGRREHFWAIYHKDGYEAAIKFYFGKHYALKYKIKKILKKL